MIDYFKIEIMKIDSFIDEIMAIIQLLTFVRSTDVINEEEEVWTRCNKGAI